MASILAPGAKTVALPLLYLPENLSLSPWNAWFGVLSREEAFLLDAGRDNLFVGAWQGDNIEAKPHAVGFQESLSTWTLAEGREAYPVYCWRNNGRLVLDQNFQNRKGILFDDLCWRAAGNFVRLHSMNSFQPSRPFFLMQHSLNQPENLKRRRRNLEDLRQVIVQSKLEGHCRILLTAWPSRTDRDLLSEEHLRVPSLLILAAEDAAPALLPGVATHLSALTPWLLGMDNVSSSPLPSAPLIWQSSEAGQAVRLGKWKLILPAVGEIRLHDLAVDPDEMVNLAASHQEQVQALLAFLQ